MQRFEFAMLAVAVVAVAVDDNCAGTNEGFE